MYSVLLWSRLLYTSIKLKWFTCYSISFSSLMFPQWQWKLRPALSYCFGISFISVITCFLFESSIMCMCAHIHNWRTCLVLSIFIITFLWFSLVIFNNLFFLLLPYCSSSFLLPLLLRKILLVLLSQSSKQLGAVGSYRYPFFLVCDPATVKSPQQEGRMLASFHSSVLSPFICVWNVLTP